MVRGRALSSLAVKAALPGLGSAGCVTSQGSAVVTQTTS